MFHFSSQMFLFHLHLSHPYFPFPHTNTGQ